MTENGTPKSEDDDSEMKLQTAADVNIFREVNVFIKKKIVRGISVPFLRNGGTRLLISASFRHITRLESSMAPTYPPPPLYKAAPRHFPDYPNHSPVRIHTPR